MAQRTQLDDSNDQMHEAYACLLQNGLDGAAEALRILVNEASRIERAQQPGNGLEFNRLFPRLISPA